MRRPLLLSTVFLFFVITGLYLGANFNSIPDAFATGGAFTSTKHGGDTSVDNGVWCPLPPCGVNRARGGEVAVYFDDSNAGAYAPGECAHCHEVHSSFGGTEPPPTGSVAQPYLLFKANDNNFCWYCHEMMSLGFPPNPPGYGYWGFYQGQLNFTNSSHGTSFSFRWPGDTQLNEGTTINPFTTWPRDRGGGASQPPLNACINCHTPHGIAGKGYDTGLAPASDNYSVATTSDTTVVARQLIAREEALCLNCHDGSPANATKSIKTQVDRHKDVTGLTTGSGHPVRSSTTYGRHNLANEKKSTVITGWFGANPHAECTDCHNPHVVTAGVAFGRASVTTPAKIGEVNKGVWGVTVTTTTGAITGTVELDPATHYVYQLCLKCHSSFGIGANNVNSTSAVNVGLADPYENLTNVAAEFATNNNGYHPVFGVGRNFPPAGANPNWPAIAHMGSTGNQTCNDINGVSKTTGLGHNFVSSWGPCSIVTCVDCHRYGDGIAGEAAQAEGPHGSANRWILRDVDTSISVDGQSINTLGGTASNWVCYNCHRRDIYGDQNYTGPVNANFSRMPGHPKPGNATEIDPANNAWNIGCLNCHGGDVLGGIHGTARTDIGEMTNGAPIGYRLRNGGGVRGHKINGINGATTNTCGSGTVAGPPVTANTALNGCGNNSLARDWTASYEYTGNP